MKRLFLLLSLLIPALAVGQAATSTLSTTATVTASALFEEGRGVIDNWSTVSALSSAIALVNLLIHGTKFGPVGELFAKNGLRWIRPLLAVVLGSLLGAGGALTSNGSIPQAVIVGLMAGLGSVGAHELTSMLMNRKVVSAEEKFEYAASKAAPTKDLVA